MKPTHITHPDNDTSHWSPARAAAYAQQQRIDELMAQISAGEDARGAEDDYYGFRPAQDEIEALYDELNRVSALPPLEYAAELDAQHETE